MMEHLPNTLLIPNHDVTKHHDHGSCAREEPSSSSCSSSCLASALKAFSKKGAQKPSNCRRSSMNSQTTAVTESSDYSDSTSVDGGAPAVVVEQDEKRLRFAATDDLYFTLSLHDYSDEEINSCWFQDKEYEKISLKCVKYVEKMESGIPVPCSRGLECHTRLGERTRTQNRHFSFDMVLIEQHIQRQNGIIDDEAIANVYRDVSSSSRLWARRVGLQDQREAEDCSCWSKLYECSSSSSSSSLKRPKESTILSCASKANNFLIKQERCSHADRRYTIVPCIERARHKNATELATNNQPTSSS